MRAALQAARVPVAAVALGASIRASAPAPFGSSPPRRGTRSPASSRSMAAASASASGRARRNRTPDSPRHRAARPDGGSGAARARAGRRRARGRRADRRCRSSRIPYSKSSPNGRTARVRCARPPRTRHRRPVPPRSAGRSATPACGISGPGHARDRRRTESEQKVRAARRRRPIELRGRRRRHVHARPVVGGHLMSQVVAGKHPPVGFWT